MSDKSERYENRRQLKALLGAAGYKPHRVTDVVFGLGFGGTLRGWEIRLSLYNGWLSFTTYFMDLPTLPAVRATLFERLAEINDFISVAKFVKSGAVLTLDMEYRFEHVDPAVLQNLIGMFHKIAEEQYPEIARIVSGQSALQGLEDAFKRPSVAGGVK